MELRKQKEREHANRLKTLLKGTANQETVEPNRKFYSITRGSRNYAEKRLLERIANGKKFLDYCCGEGKISIWLAKNGANVTGIDISDGSIEIAKANAAAQGLINKPALLIMDAENLEFNDNTFNTIICSGVLHHLDIQKAYLELARVLKPKGEIICIEPLAYNPVFQLYRKMTPRLRTKWEMEHILTKKEIGFAKKHFNKIEIKFFHLATLAAVPFRKFSEFQSILGVFEKLDYILLKMPLLKWLAWQIVFILSEPKVKK
jgi:ubiquinone/menaquinone biosynthesis C-methylase UbiE